MTVREVIRMGHPGLRVPAAPYPTENLGSEAFNELVSDMRETLHAYGGIGLAAVELGKALGARVVAAASSQDKLDVALAMGADANGLTGPSRVTWVTEANFGVPPPPVPPTPPLIAAAQAHGPAP